MGNTGTQTDEEIAIGIAAFNRFKEKVPGYILFFRIGDFYEAFFEDAKICSKVLNHALVNIKKSSHVKASVPYDVFKEDEMELLEAGYKVAVFEQIESGGYLRDVVRKHTLQGTKAG